METDLEFLDEMEARLRERGTTVFSASHYGGKLGMSRHEISQERYWRTMISPLRHVFGVAPRLVEGPGVDQFTLSIPRPIFARLTRDPGR